MWPTKDNKTERIDTKRNKTEIGQIPDTRVFEERYWLYYWILPTLRHSWRVWESNPAEVNSTSHLLSYT